MTTRAGQKHRRPYQLGIDVGSTCVKAVVWTATADSSPATGATTPTRCAHPGPPRRR